MMSLLRSTIFGLLLITACSGIPQQPNVEDDYYDDGGPETEPEPDVEVEKTPPEFVNTSGTITVREGDNVEIPCQIKKPTQQILLFKKTAEKNKNEVLIYAGTMKIGQATRFMNDNNVFKLSNVGRSEAGTYLCYYQLFSDIKLSYVLDVQYPPHVIAKSDAVQRVPKGSEVSVKCQARGNPMPNITWTKETGRLPSGAQKEAGYSMTLENVDKHVEGTYICTADNGVGKVAASMKVLVEYSPEITTEKAIIRTGMGDKVELVCIVYARPGATVRWTKDGNPLAMNKDVVDTVGGHRHAITISHVTEEHFGNYTCDAANERGNSSATINLTDLPRQPHFTSLSASAEETTYTLAWETESYYPIVQYVLKYRLAKANDSTDLPGDWVEETVDVPEESIESDGLIHRMTHTIQNLLPATDYEARVSVKNQIKWGEEGKFNFSTRKVPPTTTTTTTIATTIITTPLPLAEENVQNPTEIVSSQTTASAHLYSLSFDVIMLALILTMMS